MITNIFILGLSLVLFGAIFTVAIIALHRSRKEKTLLRMQQDVRQTQSPPPSWFIPWFYGVQFWFFLVVGIAAFLLGLLLVLMGLSSTS